MPIPALIEFQANKPSVMLINMLLPGRNSAAVGTGAAESEIADPAATGG